MAQKKSPYLKAAEALNLHSPRKRGRRYPGIRWRKVLPGFVLTAMVLWGTYLLAENHFYHSVYQVTSYKKETSDSNRYFMFQNGIVRFGRDGVAYLNQRNEVLWIQPGQFANPAVDANGQTFAAADIGGNSIQVFTKAGQKGEIETNLPIERISVSGQGIVSAILKNENNPFIVTYDSAGTILAENQVSAGKAGYPIALEMSPDGKALMVSYLETQGSGLKSRVVCYNFAGQGEEQENHQVSVEEYEGSVMPEIFFMDASVSVAVGDHSFVIYEGGTTPRKKAEVQVAQEIRSSFHTGRYIGFVLLNEEKSGFELRLYNKSGKQVMNRAFAGEYSHVQMVGDEIILYEGSKCLIYTDTGIPRFEDDLKEEIFLMSPAGGMNKYLVMNAAELQVIYLTR